MLYPPLPQLRVTQGFGLNPTNYAKFGLLGHNGIDYSATIGTNVFATDAGEVVELNDDPKGYGLYVKIRHSWGESLYAHLSRTMVSVRTMVDKGQTIALTGNSGNSTGPHLHFAIRVSPYYRDDGWGGYSDPTPHLKEITGSRLGLHLAGSRVGEMVSTIGSLAPRTILYLDPNPDTIRAIRQVSSDTLIVGRIYRPDSEVADRIKANPSDAASWIDGLIRSHPAYGLCDYWQVVNEVCQVAWPEYCNLCDTMLVWMRLARREYGCAIFGFSVGQPDMPEADRLAYWRRAVPALEKAIGEGHILLIHQYGAKDLWGPDADWYINRFEHQVLPRLGYLDKQRGDRNKIPTLKSIRVIVGEYGIDGLLLGERKGFRSYTTPTGYVSMLTRMDSYTSRWPNVLGYCIYTCGHASEDWVDYDIWPDAVPPPPASDSSPLIPKVLGEPYMGQTRVFDLDGSEKDLTWLASTYDGAMVMPARISAETREVWRLAAVYVTEGPAVAKAQTGNGNLPTPNQPVAFSYPDPANPDPALPLLPVSPHNWTTRGVIQRTNGDGMTGFGLGNSYGGFYSMWVVSSVPSDLLTHFGMKGGTNHRGPLHGVWLLQPVEPTHTNLREALLWNAERSQVIQFNPTAAIQKRIFADGFVPNSPEFTLTYDGTHYVCQRAESLSTGMVRVYFAILDRWDHVFYEER